jgi:hypothetical protein
MWPIQLAFLFLLYVWYSFLPLFYVTLHHFPLDWPGWTSPCFSSTIFQNFPDISDLLVEASQVSASHKALLQMQNSASSNRLIYLARTYSRRLSSQGLWNTRSLSPWGGESKIRGMANISLFKNYFEFPCMYCSYFVPFETVAKFTLEAFIFWRSDAAPLFKVCSLN